MAVILGIDLGTCFSEVGCVHGTETVLLCPSAEQSCMVPTVFGYRDGRVFLGSEAARLALHRPGNCVDLIKKRYRDQKEFTLGGRKFSAQEIVTALIRYLIDGARASLADQYQLGNAGELRAVITIPVTYGERWRAMLEEALRECGVALHAVLTEPEAAAYHCLCGEARANGTVLVFDLGGGTCDVALLRETGNPNRPFEVLAQEGAPIGGADWDAKLRDLLGERALAQMEGLGEAELRSASDYLCGPSFLREACAVKEVLSGSQRAEWTAQDDRYDWLCSGVVTREEFEECTRGLLDQAMDVARRAAGGRKIDSVILVGGGSRMSQIEARMRREFPESEVRCMDPELAVAKGAAEFAARPERLMRRAAHSYGVGFRDAGGAHIRNEIFKGDSLPARGECRWRMRPGAVLFPVYEGDYAPGEALAAQDGERARWIMQARYLMREEEAGAVSLQSLELDQYGLLKIRVALEGSGGAVEKEVQTDWVED